MCLTEAYQGINSIRVTRRQTEMVVSLDGGHWLGSHQNTNSLKVGQWIQQAKQLWSFLIYNLYAFMDEIVQGDETLALSRAHE